MAQFRLSLESGSSLASWSLGSLWDFLGMFNHEKEKSIATSAQRRAMMSNNPTRFPLVHS